MARITGGTSGTVVNLAVTDDIRPTDEQLAGLDLFERGETLAIEAGAGTGKTTELVLLAQSTSRRGQYVAFNRAIVDDAGGKFPWTVSCSTAHSIAFQAVGKRYAHRLNGARMRSSDLARKLSLDSITVDYGVGRRILRPGFLAGLAQRTVVEFCQSADAVPTVAHVPYVDGIDSRGDMLNNQRVAQEILPAVRALWEDLQRPDGSLPFTHAHYLKIWQLDEPRIPADYILFDEAQDASPVLLAAVNAQTHAQRVYVGDSQQQLYAWLGAVNALASVEASARCYLTQSFRFGPAIAEVANRYLGLLGAELRLRGCDRASTVGPVERPAAILTRTNATAVSVLLEGGRKTHVVGGGEEMIRFCRSAEELQSGSGTGHPELACFTDWTDVQAYVKDEEGTDLKLLVSLIDRYGAARIAGALRSMPDEKDAELVVSTAHKAKGREWSSVRLAGDFPPDEEALPSELRLLYVASTRARDALDIPVLDDMQIDDREPLAVPEVPTPMADTHLTIPVERLEPHPANPREDVGDIGDLADSIDGLGVAQALLVTPRPDTDGYWVIAGTRRLAAARSRGVKALECMVRHELDDDTVRVLSLVENGLRKSLSPLEEARTVQALLDGGQSQRGLARQIGRSQAWISNRAALLRLPEDVQADVEAGRISAEEAVNSRRERRSPRSQQPAQEVPSQEHADQAGRDDDETDALPSAPDPESTTSLSADSAQTTLDEAIEASETGATSPKPAEPLLDEDLTWVARQLASDNAGASGSKPLWRYVLETTSNIAASRVLQGRLESLARDVSNHEKFACRAGIGIFVERGPRGGKFTYLQVAQRIVELANRESWAAGDEKGRKRKPAPTEPESITEGANWQDCPACPNNWPRHRFEDDETEELHRRAHAAWHRYNAPGWSGDDADHTEYYDCSQKRYKILHERENAHLRGERKQKNKPAPATVNGTATQRMEVPPAPPRAEPAAADTETAVDACACGWENDTTTDTPELFAHWVDGKLVAHVDQAWTSKQWDELASYCRQRGSGQRGLRHSDQDVNLAVSGAVDAAVDDVVGMLTRIIQAWELHPEADRPTGALAVRILEARAELYHEIDEDDPQPTEEAAQRARLERHLARLEEERQRLTGSLSRNGGGSRYGEPAYAKGKNDRRRAELRALDDSIRGVRAQLVELEPADPTPADYELEEAEASAAPPLPLPDSVTADVVRAALGLLGEASAAEIAEKINDAARPAGLGCTGEVLLGLLQEVGREVRTNEAGRTVWALAQPKSAAETYAPPTGVLAGIDPATLPEDMRLKPRNGAPPAAHMDLVSTYLHSRPNEPCSVAKIWAAHKKAGVSQDEILAACQWLSQNVSDVHADSRRVFRVVKAHVGAGA